MTFKCQYFWSMSFIYFSNMRCFRWRGKKFPKMIHFHGRLPVRCTWLQNIWTWSQLKSCITMNAIEHCCYCEWNLFRLKSFWRRIETARAQLQNKNQIFKNPSIKSGNQFRDETKKLWIGLCVCLRVCLCYLYPLAEASKSISFFISFHSIR